MWRDWIDEELNEAIRIMETRDPEVADLAKECLEHEPEPSWEEKYNAVKAAYLEAKREVHLLSNEVSRLRSAPDPTMYRVNTFTRGDMPDRPNGYRLVTIMRTAVPFELEAWWEKEQTQ